MSNWITDNKPAAMVAGVGLLLFLGLSVTGYIVNSKRSELDKKISVASKEIKSANAAEITPSRASNEELEKELNRINRDISEDIKTIHILKAEWSHLNNPERLRSLAQKHIDLNPVKAEQIISYAALPFDYEPDRKMLARRNLNSIAARNKELRRLAKAER